MSESLSRARSAALFAEAQGLLPGGVSSPVRAFKSVGGTPLFIQRGAGARVWDEDGNEYVDYCASWGPLALGHAPAPVVAAIQAAAALGTSFGTPHRDEVALARLVRELQPWAERVRFVSSGTEAVMSALRLARAFTGRERVVKFDGCYHGHADQLLVKAGSGLATSGLADSAGVPQGTAATTTVLPLDDAAALRALFAEAGQEIAAVVIEPVPANCGLLLQRPEFLALLREETQRAGALLLFDEVISGFRLGPGGASARYGIRPDLLTFGKVIGGGLPVGAYAGRAEIMELVAPLGPVYQAGTLSGNPLAMAAGLATLRELQAGGFARLDERGEALEARLAPALAGHPLELVRQGSIFWLCFQSPPPRSYGALERAGAAVYARLHALLLERGVYLAPSAFEVGFVSTAHQDEDLDRTAAALREALPLAFA
ncbi:MAG: glutamate-1-semialdehyde 2,1-aminomutase [Planctomycetota bacterium]